MAGALRAVGAEREAVQRTWLVPRAALFASPAYSELQISPDGRQLAFLHPLNGVLNVWVAPLDDPKAATPVTRFDTRPPDSFQWSPDGRYILVLKDIGGEEQSQLWEIGRASCRERVCQYG